MRVTKEWLKERVETVSKAYKLDLSLGCAYGRYRVETKDGSHYYSGRGTAREIDWFLDGFIQGLDIERD